MQTVDKTLERTFISEVKDSQDETILLRGWVYKIIDLSNIVFVKLRDKSGIIQLVTNKEQIEGLKLENAIEVIGKKSKNEKAPGGIEIIVDEIKILGRTYYDKLPFEINSYKNKAALETQLDHRTIALRRPEIRAIFKVQNEIEQAYKAWGIAGNSPYPYVWKKEYDEQHYEVNVDNTNGLPYVYHNGKKLYFKRDMLASAEAVYRGLLIEQDKRSAHRYVDSYEELKGKTLLDIGAAEAIFTLDTIECIDHAYLFECDESWIEALEATFAPYKEKITIVRKYVSDVDDEDNITLDTFFRDEGKSIDNLFLKMDIEGYERKALEGAVHILEHGRQVGGSVCIYHLHDDKKVIESELKKFNLKINIQPGYLYFEKEMRSAIIRFSR